MFRYLILCLILALAVLLVSGCVAMNKDAMKMLLDSTEKMSADGEVTLRDPSLEFLWRTDTGLVLKVTGLDAKGDVEAEKNPTTAPVELE